MVILSYGTGTLSTHNGSKKIYDSCDELSLFKAKPKEFDLQKHPTVCNELGDRIQYNQVKSIQFEYY